MNSFLPDNKFEYLQGNPVSHHKVPLWGKVVIGMVVFFAIFYFDFFWEGILLLFISDLLFGIKETRFFNIALFAINVE